MNKFLWNIKIVKISLKISLTKNTLKPRIPLEIIIYLVILLLRSYMYIYPSPPKISGTIKKLQWTSLYMPPCLHLPVFLYVWHLKVGLLGNSKCTQVWVDIVKFSFKFDVPIYMPTSGTPKWPFPQIIQCLIDLELQFFFFLDNLMSEECISFLF